MVIEKAAEWGNCTNSHLQDFQCEPLIYIQINEKRKDETVSLGVLGY